MWTAICAAGLAEMIGDGEAQRLGTCEREDCGRVYVDVSKNASRRFCSLTCQNRVKVATFRERAGKRRVRRNPGDGSVNTAASLAADLVRLGVEAGMVLMVHSSLGQIGWTEGGPIDRDRGAARRHSGRAARS